MWGILIVWKQQELFMLAPMESLDVKHKFSCYAACPAGDAYDPTQVTSQWVTTTPAGLRDETRFPAHNFTPNSTMRKLRTSISPLEAK
eukprot:4729501-Amphidinium_carterae.1